MSTEKKVDLLIPQLENYIEGWKQFNGYVNLARAKKFSPQDEHQFLEVKTVLAQELELLLSLIEAPTPTREEVHELMGKAPSIRYLSEMNEGVLRNLESEWHRIFIALHSITGQLKARLLVKAGA